MKTYDGYIEYNQNLKCYGMMGHDGTWIKEALEDGDRIAIMLGNNVFETKFSAGPYFPTLNPLPWDKWDNLVGKPAAYYDFETEPKKPPRTKEEEKRSRFRLAMFGILISVAVNALLAVMFAGISAASGDSFANVFSRAFPLCYGLFGGSFVISAFLLLATNIPENATNSYGAGFYYGIFACWGVLVEVFNMEDFELAVLLSAVIVGLICYIFWLKNKQKT